jgi:PAS domain S-box-containing protein
MSNKTLNELKNKLTVEIGYCKNLTEKSSVMVVFIDAKSAKILMCNKAFSTRLGYKERELIGKKIFDFCDPDCLSTIKKYFRSLAHPYEVSGAKLQMQHKDGNKINVLLSATAIYDEHNHVVANKLMMFDIDDMKKAGEELKHRLFFEKMIINVSQKFASALPDEVDDVIMSNLKDISKFVGVDSCCVYLFSSNDIAEVAYCWEKNKKNKKLHESFKKNARPWFSKMIEVAETIYVPDVIKLPAECKVEKRIWKKQGIRSLLVVPLVYANKRIGFICFESIGKIKIWNKNDITLLLTIGEMVSGALTRKWANEEQHRNEEQLKNTLLQVIQVIAQMVETRDPYTAGHQRRVALLAAAIAEEMKLSKYQIEGLNWQL